jgi:hypothetical protein
MQHDVNHLDSHATGKAGIAIRAVQREGVRRRRGGCESESVVKRRFEHEKPGSSRRKRMKPDIRQRSDGSLGFANGRGYNSYVEGRRVRERAVQTVSAAGLYCTVLQFFSRRTMRELQMETGLRSDRSNWQKTSGNETAKIEEMDWRMERWQGSGLDGTEPFRNLRRNRRNG